MKILFLVPYPTEGASNRVRVEQFIPYMESKGVLCKVRPFVNKRFYGILYLPHCYLEKIFWFIICTSNRILDIYRARRYDIVFIHREAYPFFGPFIEFILYKMHSTIVFDFDDAIFLPSTSKYNTYIGKLKNPNKTSKIIKMSALVIAGNNYLRDFALRYNNNTIVIPSSIDTEVYRPRPAEKSEEKDIVIGWVGSNTTKNFLYLIKDVFVRLSARYKNVTFNIVGADFSIIGIDKIITKKWSMQEELKDLQGFDIGIMPMPDNDWTKGKCGFKAILYMACGLPVAASPVGMNLEIVDDGGSGFLAKDADSWVEKLSILIEDEALRQKMGKAGRENVIERYSLAVWRPIFLENLMKTYQQRQKNGTG